MSDAYRTFLSHDLLADTLPASATPFTDAVSIAEQDQKNPPYITAELQPIQDVEWKPPPPPRNAENGSDGEGHGEVAHKLAVSTTDGIDYIELADIVALHAEGSYTWVHCENGDRHLVSHNLSNVERNLPSPQFFRCHRAHVINLLKVAKLLRHGGFRALLVTGMIVEISRRHWDTLLELMQQV